MELILNGRFTNEYQEKSVELNGKPTKYVLAVLQTNDGQRFPITIWGDRKVGYFKDAMASGNETKIVVQLLAKPTTYTNHEGETVTAPNLQLKLYSFIGIPQPRTAAPAPAVGAVDPTTRVAPFNYGKRITNDAGYFSPLPPPKEPYSSSAFPELDATPGLKEIL